MKRIKPYICVAVGLLVFFSSCIREDLSECGTPWQIVFTYKDDAAMAPAPSDLKLATVFIFDKENKQLMHTWTIDNPVLGQVYEPEIELTAKEYNFVVWFNLSSPYESASTSSVSGSWKNEMEFRLQLPDFRRVEEPAFALPLSLYGSVDAVVKLEATNKVVVPVVQNTNLINIAIHGLPQSEETYRFIINDDNGRYNFDNEFSPCAAFNYITEATYTPGSETLNASLTVLKLSASHPRPVLSIVNANGGAQLFPWKGITDNLVQLILLANPQNNFDKTHVYNIEMDRVIEPEMGFSITVNGWKVIPSNNEIMP